MNFHLYVYPERIPDHSTAVCWQNRHAQGGWGLLDTCRKALDDPNIEHYSVNDTVSGEWARFALNEEQAKQFGDLFKSDTHAAITVPQMALEPYVVQSIEANFECDNAADVFLHFDHKHLIEDLVGGAVKWTRASWDVVLREEEDS